MGMMRALRRRNPGEPLWKILWWEFSRVVLYAMMFLLWRYRTWGVKNIPKTGGVLLISNHQSFLDLAVVGVGLTHRHFHPMARATLFKNPLFAKLIRAYNAFEVDRDKADLKSIRKAIELLQAGHLVLIFPEGSRSPDGQVHDFQEGIMLLIRRAKPVIVPMAVEGSYDIWPIGQKRPKLHGRAVAVYGEPISSETLLAMKTPEAMAYLKHRVVELNAEAKRKIAGR